MEQEFTTAIAWKIIYGTIAIVLAGFSIIVGHPKTSAGALAISLILIATAIVVIVNIIKRRVIISDYSITSITVWGTKELANINVKGFKVGDKAIYIKPINGFSKMTIRDYMSIGNSSDLIECLKTHYADLNAIEYQQEHEEILNDPNLGFSTEEREESFNKARRTSLIYNIGGFVLFFVALALFKHNQIIDAITLLYPLAGIFIISLSRGLIKLIAKKSSAYYNLFLGIYMPLITLLIKSIVDFHILNYHTFKLPFILIVAILFTILYVFSIRKSTTLFVGQLAVALIFSSAYSYGSIIRINCAFDRSNPKIYTPVILDQHIVTGKKDSYYIKLGPWGTRVNVDDINVTYSTYNDVKIGGHLNIYLKKGLLNIPWYYLPE